MKISTWTRNLLSALAAAGFATPAAYAASLNTELVVNGGFESVDPSIDGLFESVGIDGGWNDAAGDSAFAYPYSSEYSGEPQPLGGGDWHFTGGFSTTAGEVLISQTVDLSAGEAAAVIAEGTAQFALSGFFSSYFEQGEATEVRVRLLDAAGGELASGTVGGVDFLSTVPLTLDTEGFGDGFERVDWGRDRLVGDIPVGTVAAEVEVLAGGEAQNHDGYLDQVSFQVVPEPTTGALVGLVFGLGVSGSPLQRPQLSSPGLTMKISSWTKKLRRAMVVGGLCLPGAAVAADLDTNLVVNGGFESVDADTSGPFTSVAIDGGWVDAGNAPADLFAYPYSSAYSGSTPPAGAGDWHFTGGFGTSEGQVQLSQLIDLSGGATGTLIPTGEAAYNLSGFFSSYLAQGEGSVVRARFLDSQSNEVGVVSIGGSGFLETVPITAGQVDWGQDLSIGLIPSATASVTIEIVADGEATNYDGYVDLVDFLVTEEFALPTLDMVIDRSGGITLQNRTGGPVNLTAYSILSPAGSLDPSAWDSIADNSDANSGGGVDPNNVWTKLTAPTSSGDLSEADLDSGQGTTLAVDQTLVLNGYVPSNVEHVQFSYASGGQVISGIVNYSGNGGESFPLGDFDTDNDIDADDYAILIANQFKDLPGGTTASYLLGDTNRDGRNDHADFIRFQAAFDAANGQGSFARMVTGVPEPSTALVVGAGFAAALVAPSRSIKPKR